ncbi:hypothetical protein RB195_008536 [Necator americanus]|uniref:Uncharacterized protein n=1 Tax=Necator americanus TaxID=51031 RepID=A0ABR1CPY5_NECAM
MLRTIDHSRRHLTDPLPTALRQHVAMNVFANECSECIAVEEASCQRLVNNDSPPHGLVEVTLDVALRQVFQTEKDLDSSDGSDLHIRWNVHRLSSLHTVYHNLRLFKTFLILKMKERSSADMGIALSHACGSVHRLLRAKGLATRRERSFAIDNAGGKKSYTTIASSGTPWPKVVAISRRSGPKFGLRDGVQKDCVTAWNVHDKLGTISEIHQGIVGVSFEAQTEEDSGINALRDKYIKVPQGPPQVCNIPLMTLLSEEGIAPIFVMRWIVAERFYLDLFRLSTFVSTPITSTGEVPPHILHSEVLVAIKNMKPGRAPEPDLI